MSAEIVSGLASGLFGTVIAKLLGKFRLWKVFVTTFVLIYGGLFMTGLVLVGLRVTLTRFGEFFSLFPLLIFGALSASVTFVAYLGRNAARKAKDDEVQ